MTFLLQTLPMLDNRQPRHTIRAQGRALLGERAQFQPSSTSSQTQATEGQSAQSSPANAQTTVTERQYGRLLDYLSHSAAGSDRTILDHASLGAVVSSSTAAQLLEAWFNAGSKKSGLGPGSNSNISDSSGADADIEGLSAAGHGYFDILIAEAQDGL